MNGSGLPPSRARASLPRMPGDTAQHRRQRRKNLAVMGGLLLLVVIFYLTAIVRMSGG